MTTKPRAYIDIHREFEEIATRLVALADELQSKGYSPMGQTSEAMKLAHWRADNRLYNGSYGNCLKEMGAFVNIFRGRYGEEEAYLQQAHDIMNPPTE